MDLEDQIYYFGEEKALYNITVGMNKEDNIEWV